MRKTLTWVGFAIAMGLCIGVVVNVMAQSIVNLQPSGNECWNAGQGPGGPSQFLCINQVRNTGGLSAVATASGVLTPNTNINTLAISATVVPPQGTTIVTPGNPVADGQFFQVCNVSGANFSNNAMVLTPASGQTMLPTNPIVLTSLASKSCVEVVFQLSGLTWFQIR